MTKTRQLIVTGQMRIRLDPLEHDEQQIDARTLAAAARQFIHEQLGISRVKLQAPKLGRGEDDGSVPAFCYGTFDFAFELPAPARTRQAATGKTRKLRRS